ncbi:MAG: VWA domain-containing protein [Planctomycetota bacterium]
MTFAAPWMLWSLLALLPLLAVYLLKVRPRRTPTTAFFLWEKVFNQNKSNRLWHRLRNLWSLLIMAAAFALIALALGEPRWSDDERRDLLILIDNSASMQTQEGGGSRLELAKEKARGLARALDGVQRAAVATVADRLRYQSHLTDNPRELLAAIDKIEPTYESFRIEALPSHQDLSTGEPEGAGDGEGAEQEEEQAENLARQRRVLLVTDGVMSGAEAPDGVELLMVSGEQTNVGIVAVDLQFVPGAADRMSFYYQLASTHTAPVEIDLLLSRQDEAGIDQLAKVIPLTVEPGVNPPQTLSVEGAEPGRWIATLDGDTLSGDALAADNTAWLVARRPPPIAMAVASDDRYFFEQSVRAFTIGSSALRLVDEGAQVVLAKGSVETPRAIVFQPDGESPWWGRLGDEVDVDAVKVLVEDHPLLRHLDPLSISFLGARRLTPPTGSRVLVESNTGVPLIYTAGRGGDGAVVVNLDPVAAEFYFSAWFPVLVHASATHLAGREEPLLAVYKPGDTVNLPADAESFSGRLAPPTGPEAPLAEPRLRSLDATGFYTIENTTAAGESEWTVACSLLSAGESLVTTEREAEPPASLATGGPPGAWLIVLALVAATAESLLYHRRKVG